MPIAVRFWIQLALWSAILLAAFTLLDRMGDDHVSIVARLPVWGGLALVLAAFPAGVAVSAGTFPGGRWSTRRAAEATGAAFAVSLVVFVLVGFLGPAAVRTSGAVSPDDANASRRMSIVELRRSAVAAVAEAEARADREPLSRWRRANILAWDYHRRLAGVAQPVLFAWIGLLAGLWAGWTKRRELVHAQYWALGLFLIMSTYLAGENSYELIALQAAGPAFFAGFFVLIVPTILLMGLGWATFAALWRRSKELP